MNKVYACVFTSLQEGGYMAYSPDFDCNTQGETLDEAIEMIRDAIALVGITLEDLGMELPNPMPIAEVQHSDRDVVTMVYVDFQEYRLANQKKSGGYRD